MYPITIINIITKVTSNRKNKDKHFISFYFNLCLFCKYLIHFMQIPPAVTLQTMLINVITAAFSSEVEEKLKDILDLRTSK